MQAVYNYYVNYSASTHRMFEWPYESCSVAQAELTDVLASRFYTDCRMHFSDRYAPHVCVCIMSVALVCRPCTGWHVQS
jgi:hypothetical protein